MSSDNIGRPEAPVPSFRALESDALFLLESGERIRFYLDGIIRINGEKLLDANGPDRRVIIDNLGRHYRTKGEAFLKDLEGSFRLAVWDTERQTLLLAVDPLATRPIYYSHKKNMLLFASRMAAFSKLTEISKIIDPNVLYFYLNHSFVPAPFTIFKGIHRLEPGQYLRWQNESLNIRQYWDIRYEEDRNLSIDAAAELVRSGVEQSVRFHLASQSCGPDKIGAFLSGGTDSSTLLGLMTKINGDGVKTFSVGFTEQEYNEIEYSRIAAFHYHAVPHECFVSADDALEVLPLLAAQFDEPFGNSSAIPTYLDRKSTRLNSSHLGISYAVFCLKKK